MVFANEFAARFAWTDIVWNVLSERMTQDELRSSMLVNTKGSDTDFSGHGCWELAANMISRGLRKHGLLVDLHPKSACVPWLVVRFKMSYDPPMVQVWILSLTR